MARRHTRRTKRLIRRLVFALVVVLVIGGVVGVIYWHPTGTGRGRRVRRGTPVVALAYTCDLRGKLLPCTCEEGSLGGVGRMAGLLDAWREQRADALFVNVGNALVEGRPDARTLNQFTLEALDLLGCAVLNCGENEVALPLDELQALAIRHKEDDTPTEGNGHKVKVISASVTDAATAETLFPIYHLEARGGVQIAFIGLVHKDMDPARIGKGVSLLEPEDALREALARLGDQADLVVVLAYLSGEQIYDLARKYPKVNLFLGGKVGASSAAYELVRGTAVAYLGDQGFTLGRIEAAFPTGKLPVVQASVHRLEGSAPESKQIKALLDRLAKAIDYRKRPGADFDPTMPCTSSFVASEVARLPRCHTTNFYSWQATPHAGSYATLLQKYAVLEQAGKAPKQKFTDNPECLACHVTGYTMPAGFGAKRRELEQAEAAARKRELERKLQALKPDDAERAAVEEQLAELRQRDLGRFATLEAPDLDKETQTLARALDALKHVGCECCHGGGRRHVAIALKDRSAAARTPYQRDPISARSCDRCHHGERPCLPEDQADPFDRAAYLKKIQHW